MQFTYYDSWLAPEAYDANLCIWSEWPGRLGHDWTPNKSQGYWGIAHVVAQELSDVDASAALPMPVTDPPHGFLPIRRDGLWIDSVRAFAKSARGALVFVLPDENEASVD